MGAPISLPSAFYSIAWCGTGPPSMTSAPGSRRAHRSSNTSSISITRLATATGADIPIEERGSEEITHFGERPPIPPFAENYQMTLVRPVPVAVSCIENGPLQFEGRIRIVDYLGQQCTKPRGKLCRCGQSASKPFCDGSHSRVGFKSSKPEK